MPKRVSHRKVKGGSVWSWIKDKALPWIKKNKIVSRGAAALGGILPGGYGTAAKAISTGASTMGWGRRRTHGGSLMSTLKRAHDFTKKHRLISRGAMGLHRLTGNAHLKTVGSVAGTLGYGLGYGGGALAYSRGAGRKKKR
jgi:hypothetical protein